MLNVHENPHCFEFYLVEKSIEVVVNLKVGSESTIRINALRDMKDNVYSTRAYVERRCNIQFAEEEGGREEQLTTWVEYELPWVRRDSADEALNDALSWLRERCE